MLAVVLLAVVAAGCGLDQSGTGSGSSGARVLVSQDFGTKVIGARVAEDEPAGDTLMKLLQSQFKVTKTPTGRSVQSIDGVGTSATSGWRFFVNGIRGEKGATRTKLYPGDRIWFDHHDLTASRSVPAVVGSYPEPFVHGYGGRRWPVLLECDDPNGAACDEVSNQLSDVGVIGNKQVIGTGVGEETFRVFVGPWRRLRSDLVLRQIDRGPQYGGVYVHFNASGSNMSLLNGAGKPVQTLGAGTGLIAATRFEGQAPTWAITGTNDAGVLAAARALTEQQLTNKFAVAISGGRAIGAPVVP